MPYDYQFKGFAMNEKSNKYNIIINNIEFRMIRKGANCWIKAVSLIRLSNPSSIHIILNDEYYHWDIYDENGIEAHEIYFEGSEITPSFYLKSGNECYRIDFKNNEIKVISINKVHKPKDYIKENCKNNSLCAFCWAKAIYYTSRSDKPPFNEM